MRFRAYAALLGGIVSVAVADPARAITITNIAYFQNVGYPSNGALYTLPTILQFTVGPGDFAGGFLPVSFIDPVLSQPFDWLQVSVPANLGPGTTLRAALPFSMGCTVAQSVFGPLQTFNNDAVTGSYNFSTLNLVQQGSHIDCITLGPGGGPQQPDYEDPTAVTPPAAPYNPYGQDLLPTPYLNANGQAVTIVAAQIVPEPQTVLLMCCSLVFMAIGVRLRQRRRFKLHSR